MTKIYLNHSDTTRKYTPTKEADPHCRFVTYNARCDQKCWVCGYNQAVRMENRRDDTKQRKVLSGTKALYGTSTPRREKTHLEVLKILGI